MFKDKVKVTVVALVMVLLMVLSITTDLFVGLADVFRAKAEEATPTDATPVTRDVTVYKELNDSDKDRNLAGAVIKVFKDSACTESITEFVLSYDGKSYGGDDRVVYKSLEERANANASKAIAKLQEDTYYYQLDKKLFRSNDDYSKTGYDYNNIVGSFSIVAGDGVQEIKLDNNMFRPTEKVATSTDASSEVSTEVNTEATTEPDTQVATTSDASSEETETTTQIATPTDSIPEVKPVATLASVFRMAKAAKAATTTAVSRGTGYGYDGGTISYIFYINKGLTYNNTGYAFCMEEDKTGPTSGTGTVSSIGKSNITKALYYSFAGPGAGSYDGAPSSGGLNGDNVMTLSCILDYYYTGYWDSGDFGTAYDNAISYEKWLKGKDMPNTLADTAFSIAGKSDDFTASRAAYNITDKTQTTNEWAVVSKKSVTVTIPTGVTMHKTDSKGKKSTHGAGTATVSNGDKIYFSASIAKGGTSDIKFTSVKGYSAYKADFGAKLQVLGFLGEPTDKEFTAKLQWNSPNFSLRKTDSKTKQPVEGAEYLVYCAQDNEKVNVVRFKTNSNGVGEITSVNPTQASGEVGKTVVKLKAGVRYYIVETKAPEHYKLNKNKQVAIGGEKYPYEAHIGVNATDGHVDYTSITGATFSTTATGVTYHTVDKVAHDPVSIVIRKIDSVSGRAVPAGTAALAGAVFKMEYFKGKDSVSGSATNTWYLQTKLADGRYVARFARGYLYSDSTHKSDAAPAEVDASGVYELEAGCMRITEVIAPSGYEKVTADNAGWIKLGGSIDRLTESASITVKIGNGNIYYGNTAVKDGVVEIGEQKERYDFKLKKVDSYGNPMAGVAFLVTASNGDQHVVVTDKNGEFDSSKLDYTNVNGNDATLAKAMADTTLYPTYKETNVFFTTPGSGKTAAAEIKEETVDGKAPRPLYKDTYTIREIHRQYVTIDGKKYKLTQVYDLGPAQKITVSDSAKNGAVIDFGTYTNTAIPKMTSSAISTDTNTKMSVAGKNSSFKDSVKATNLKASTKYTLMSVAVDANTGKAYKDADGKYVAKNVEFTTGAVKKGTVFPETTASVTFTGVNTSNVKSRKLVFYEYLVEGSVTKTVSLDSAGKPVEPANCVAKDASVSNKAQTVNVISLETKVLVDSTKTNVAPADEKVDVTDTVTLHNLVAETKFTLVGKVSDGENIKVENEVEFTAKGDDETVSVPLKGLNLTEYAGKSLYVICELKYDGEVIATHNEDGTDPDEKFYVPAVETNAIDATTNTQYSILDKTQIIDSVKYSNLPTEYEYELETTFVDSATGEEIKKTEIEKDPCWSMLKDLGYVTDETSSDSTGDSVAEDTGKIVSEVGKAFKRTQILKPEKMDDMINVAFDIDPRSFNLEGKTITIQQVIKLNGVVVAKHTDKDAESQQISFPTGSTLAVDNTSHNHTIAPTKNADVVDTIFCKNLAIGISVDFYGIAIDKDTNKPVELNGKPVVVKQNETISKADQEVQLHYVVDGTKLKGKRLTSFVFAVYNGKIVFKHTDLNSAEQSFSFSSLRTKFLDDKNGTHATMLTEDVHQTDTVTLDGLTKGEGFTLKGVVYNKSTRKPMLVNGKQVTNSIDFTAKGNSEEVALKYQYNGLKSDAYHKDKNDDLVSFVYLYKDGILIDKEEDFDSFDQTIKLPSCGTSASDGITKLHVGYASKTAIFRDSVDYYNLIVGDWYSTTLTLHLNKDGKDAGPLKDANGNLITATVKFQAKTTDGSVKVEVKYDASLLAGETITAFETIRTKGYEVCGHTEITDEGQQIHYPELKTSAKNSKDNSQHVKEGEVAKIVDTVNYSKLDSSVAYKVVTEAWDYNTQQIVVSDGKKVRKVTELHVDSKKPENGSFDVSMSFKTDGLGKHRIVIFEYVYDNKGNLISKEADFDAESQTIYIDKTPNKTGDRTVMFLSILAGMLGLGVVTLFVTRRKKK
ncbi:MAG: VaFE repeat-containing surface-anchored protein [Coprococcus sp.]